MQAIEAALELKMAPTVLIYNARQPGDDWDELDKQLAVAVHMLKKQICSKCGQPLWICRSTDPNLDFSIKTATCYASKALEDVRAKREKSKKQLKHGEFEYIEPIMLFDKPFPSRSDWLQSLQED